MVRTRKPETYLALILLVTVALGGCTSAETGEAASASPEVSAGGPAPTNETIQAVIVVLVDGNATSADGGPVQAMAGANLTFDGSTSVGSNLSYSWDLGDDSTGANATEVHAYAEAGTFNVTLTVAAGNQTSTASVALNISAGGPKKGDLAWTDAKSFSGSLAVGNPNSAAVADTDYRDHPVKILAAAPDGTPAMAKKIKIVLDGSGAAALDLYLYWRQGSSNLNSTTTSGLDKSVTYERDMPAGDYVLRVRFATGAQASYTVKADILYYAT